MQLAVRLILLAIFLLEVESEFADNNPFIENSQEIVCVPLDRLKFEDYFVYAGRPEVSVGSCTDGVSAYRAKNAAQSACYQGYARHSNGRCYRIVDAPQNGGRLWKHEYRVLYRGGCQAGGPERRDSDLDPAVETLDLCEEDGGCIERWQGGGRVVPLRSCAAGHAADVNGRCQRLVDARLIPGRNPKPAG